MIDKQGRIQIPKDFTVLRSDRKEVYFYYSIDKELFFILDEYKEELYFIGKRKLETKGRICLPKEVCQVYKTENILLVQSLGGVYLIPIKEE